MTTNETTKTFAATTRRDGALLWTMTERGPRGGTKRWYAPRAAGQTAPSGWVVWSERQSDVGTGDVAGSYTIR